jgi:hypothetical protein
MKTLLTITLSIVIIGCQSLQDIGCGVALITVVYSATHPSKPFATLPRMACEIGDLTLFVNFL